MYENLHSFLNFLIKLLNDTHTQFDLKKKIVGFKI